MVFAEGRKPKARRREAVIAAAKLRCLFSIRRFCHGLRTFLHWEGPPPVPESAASLPGNGGRIIARRRTRGFCRAQIVNDEYQVARSALCNGHRQCAGDNPESGAAATRASTARAANGCL